MFPYKDGGMLISKNKITKIKNIVPDFFEYQLSLISEKRIVNYNELLGQLRKSANKHIEILRPDLDGSVPQTFPILLSSNELRDKLYFKLNENGFGVVSLYHQLIDEVGSEFVNERQVSSQILNLPIHQDCSSAGLTSMVELIIQICNGQNS
jgi:dTDP-4-amino-4,6-dideoxygalactose transaminase